MPESKPAELPEPSAEARAHSARLVACVLAEIERNDGRIPFSTFMNMALYQPGLGYYSADLAKFGEAGDFITAPEISSLFGQCLARQVAPLLAALGRAEVLEFGAGSGKLAADLLAELAARDVLPARYCIVELSASLRARQQALLARRLPDLVDRIDWIDSLPEAFEGVVIANEVLDAMPVERFCKQAGGYERIMVSARDGQLRLQAERADAAMRQRLGQIEARLETALPAPYCSEYNPSVAPWLQALSAALSRGVVLLIDYGYAAAEYYHPQRNQGSLMCHYRHRAHADALWYPGLQDITAFVDFSEVAHAATACGFSVAGYTSQAAFLLGNGLEEAYAAQYRDEVVDRLRLAQQVKTLTLPSEMGERFKVMALAKDMPEGLGEALPAFALQDWRNRL